MNSQKTRKVLPIEEVDLRKIEGEGDFPCPECGSPISPEDESEKVYKVTNVETRGNQISSITIQCRCGLKIKIIGFKE